MHPYLVQCSPLFAAVTRLSTANRQLNRLFLIFKTECKVFDLHAVLRMLSMHIGIPFQEETDFQTSNY